MLPSRKDPRDHLLTKYVNGLNQYCRLREHLKDRVLELPIKELPKEEEEEEEDNNTGNENENEIVEIREEEKESDKDGEKEPILVLKTVTDDFTLVDSKANKSEYNFNLRRNSVNSMSVNSLNTNSNTGNTRSLLLDE